MTQEDLSRIEFVVLVILWLIVALLLRELGVLSNLTRMLRERNNNAPAGSSVDTGRGDKGRHHAE